MGKSIALTDSRNRSPYTLVGYLLLLLALIVGAIALGGLMYLLVIGSGWMPSHESIIKWTGLAVSTPAMSAYVIKRSHRYWRMKAFWIGTLGLLALHVGCFLALFALISNWRMFWIFLICTVEAPLIESLATKIARRFGT
ncbi:MAG TPA: hypothetical protein VMU80_12340 [Bryobacteraceae bacterium]|nr:hypothetical protein [Bryobacteraceae bacterium]